MGLEPLKILRQNAPGLFSANKSMLSKPQNALISPVKTWSLVYILNRNKGNT